MGTDIELSIHLEAVDTVDQTRDRMLNEETSAQLLLAAGYIASPAVQEAQRRFGRGSLTDWLGGSDGAAWQYYWKVYPKPDADDAGFGERYSAFWDFLLEYEAGQVTVL